jgi:methionine-rich copper-binding protein CopC
MRQRKQKIVAIIILVVTALTLLLGAFSGTADAHAGVGGTNPANGASLTASPGVISIAFTEAVSTDGKRVQLLDANGKVLAVTWQQSDGGERQELRPKKPLTAGSYAVRWSVTSGDGHIVTGASSFNIKRADAARKTTRVTLTQGSAKTTLTLGSNRAGRTKVSITGTTFTGVEFTNKLLGATLRYNLTAGSATVVLPMRGTWTVTAVEKPSEYRELRWTGSFKLQ